MGVLEAVARIVQLGGAPERAAAIAARRADFEARTGAFASEDGWFEERSRAFWCDAVTRGRFGRDVEAQLNAEERAWLGPLEHAHRGLFRAEMGVLVDVWSGAELIVRGVDDESSAELAAAAGQLFDARVVGPADAKLGTGPADAKPGTGPADAKPGTGPADAKLGTGPVDASAPSGLWLLPGAVFHPREATAAIAPVLEAARVRPMSTHEVLDALLRMERVLRSLTRVKAAFAYRPDALTPRVTASPVRRFARGPT
jgi:hypothetical protein